MARQGAENRGSLELHLISSLVSTVGKKEEMMRSKKETED